MTTDFFQFLLENWYRFIGAAVIAYLLGSINFSIIITNFIMKKDDIRTMGSGNAGFTNVLRSVGKGPAIATIALDFLKGVVAVFVGGLIFSSITQNPGQMEEYVSYGKYIAGLFCIAGHMYPVFFGFKGGKGVVTTASLALVVDWRVFLAAMAIFGLLFLITKIISVASLLAAVSYPIFTFCFAFFMDYLPKQKSAYPTFTYVVLATVFSVGVAVFIITKHKSNIVRIFNGTEKKITSKKQQSKQ